MLRYLILASLIVPATGLADHHRPEDWPEGSAMHTGLTAKLELVAADERLNRVYEQLMRALPEDDLEGDHYPKKTLREAQRAWIRFRDAECALRGETEGGMRMWKSAFDTMCQSELTQARVERLEELLGSVTPAE